VWAANDAAFQALAEDNALLAELKPLSKDLAAVGQIGLKALDYMAAGQAAPQDWVKAQTAELARMAKPNAEVSLAAVRPVKVLLEKLGH
jgi:hexosaminidase